MTAETLKRGDGGAGAKGLRSVLVLVGIGFLAMFASSFIYRFENPSLIMRTGHGGGAAMPAEMEGLMQLMRQLQENPDDLNLQLRAAEQFMMMGAYERAEAFLKKAEAVAPNDPAVLNDYGIVLYNLDRPEAAKARFEKILAADPDNHRAHYNLGLLYKYAFKDMENARTHFQAVLESDEADADSRKNAREEMAPPAR